MMNTNLRGEMTVMECSNGNDGNTRGLDIFTAITRALQLSSEDDVETVKDMVIPTVFFTAVVNGDMTRLEEVYRNVSISGGFSCILNRYRHGNVNG